MGIDELRGRFNAIKEYICNPTVSIMLDEIIEALELEESIAEQEGELK